MRAGVIRLEDAEMQISDLAFRSVGIHEISAGNHAVKDAARAFVIAPAENLIVELSGGCGIVGGEIDEDQGIGCRHGVSF